MKNADSRALQFAKKIVTWCGHWCEFVPLQSKVDVLSYALFEESVESFDFPITLWPVRR